MTNGLNTVGYIQRCQVKATIEGSITNHFYGIWDFNIN